jgi:aldehyde dehydrogenase (NAD+)
VRALGSINKKLVLFKARTVRLNTYRAVPFGGYKASGLGRENGAEAIEGCLQSNGVWINNGPGGGNPFIMKPAS